MSVSLHRDAEQADIRLEERELRRDPQGELRELAGVYEKRGLPPALASEVAVSLSSRGALAAHARDELGLDEQRLARPFQAAWTSALSLSAGATLPLLAVAATPARARVGVAVLLRVYGRGDVGELEENRPGVRGQRAPAARGGRWAAVTAVERLEELMGLAIIGCSVRSVLVG